MTSKFRISSYGLLGRTSVRINSSLSVYSSRSYLAVPPTETLRQLHFSKLKSLVSSSTCEAYYGRVLLQALLTPDEAPFTNSARSTGGQNMPSVEPDSEQSESGKVSDQEWEIRTGRAIYILQQTLPEFFETGLVSSLDHSLDDHASSSKAWSLPNPTDTWHSIKGKLSPTSKSPRESEEVNEAPSIYSPRIHLTYTPPVPLPAPLPKTLHTEGLHLYIASSIFVRHTLNALYTDLAVEIKRVRVTNGGPTQGSLLSLPQPSPSRRQRDKSISFGLGVSGVGRVSGARTEWEINCTYIFSPLTGLIVHHSVDSIEPAPHQGLFEALGKFGLLEAGIGPRTGGVGS